MEVNVNWYIDRYFNNPENPNTKNKNKLILNRHFWPLTFVAIHIYLKLHVP